MTIGTGEAGRAKIARLTRAGLVAKDACRQRMALIETGWTSRFGASNVNALRDALAPLVGGAASSSSPLFLGLEPYPDGWRASVERLQTLPHYPMVLHRGGFPDGS